MWLIQLEETFKKLSVHYGFNCAEVCLTANGNLKIWN